MRIFSTIKSGLCNSALPPGQTFGCIGSMMVATAGGGDALARMARLAQCASVFLGGKGSVGRLSPFPITLERPKDRFSETHR